MLEDAEYIIGHINVVNIDSDHINLEMEIKGGRTSVGYASHTRMPNKARDAYPAFCSDLNQ